MPAKNTIRQFSEECYYHVYNRGVEKRIIFLDKQDYTYFLLLLNKYLDPTLGSDPKSLSNEVHLLAYCLMPNHFHLQLKQITKNGITKLMRKLSVCYVGYFNTKYKRQGALFQGKYKAAIILNDSYFLHVNRYIHLNPKGSDPKTYKYSSLYFYLENKTVSWIKKEEILGFFKTNLRPYHVTNNSYASFIDNNQINSEGFLGQLTLENEEGSDPKTSN